jgi:hypothetical protein
MEDLFHLPLSEEAWQEYQALQIIRQGIQITDGARDCWKYILGKSKYSSSKFYNLHYKSVEPPLPFIWIWNSKCTNKIKVFDWLLLMDKLNVRNILRRKQCKLERNDYTCVLCSRGREETTFSLLQLYIQSGMLEGPKLHVGFQSWLLHDGWGKEQVSTWLLHGNLLARLLAYLKAKKYIYLQ